jgi:hypothetical protein
VAARKITTFACGGGDASSHLSEPVICQLRASRCHADERTFAAQAPGFELDPRRSFLQIVLDEDGAWRASRRCACPAG